MKKTYLVVGAGFTGAVLARELACAEDCNVLVIDSRNHIGGNCHTERDPQTQIMVHKYGPHIFHTSREDVWNYIQKFGRFNPYTNRVKASTPKGIFSLPINLSTINQFYGKQMSPIEAQAWIKCQADASISEPRNFEEQAVKMIGNALYKEFFYGYTQKQWGCAPKELPASILKRLPVRFNYDDNYYSSKYQGIPEDGYTKIIERILDHPSIEVQTSTPFTPKLIGNYHHIFYTGPIDAYYNHSLGRLGYRTVYWEKLRTHGDFQGTAVINYPDLSVKHTRIHEHKHFTPWENHKDTLVFTEYSKETEPNDTPYYPKRLTQDMVLMKGYTELALKEKKVSFLGRLATYRYLDMHQVIGETLDFINTHKRVKNWPIFPIDMGLNS